MAKNIKWEGAGTKLPSGHTIIETNDDGTGVSRWAIFDQSGRTPETTHDGILWLDRERTIKAGTRHAPTVPVVSPEGATFSVPVDAPTMLRLSQMLRWTIEDDVRGHFYNVR